MATVAAGTACLALTACGGSIAPIDHSVLGIHVTGSWNGDLLSPRAATCTPNTEPLAVEWIGTVGDRIVDLFVVNIVSGDRVGRVSVGGGTTHGAVLDPRQPQPYIAQDNVTAATLDDQMSAEHHDLGGSIVVALDGQSGTLDLHDLDLHLTGSWRC